MKALFLCAVLLCASIPVIAGDTSIPPAPPAPPCQENCTEQAIVARDPMPLKTQLLLALLGIIR